MDKKKNKKMMSLDEFQQRCLATAIYPQEAEVIYPLLGLSGELGEFIDVLLDAIWPSEEECKGILQSNIYFTLKKLSDAAKECERLKKKIRDTKTFTPLLSQLNNKVLHGLDKIDREELIKEAGDFMSWYSNVLASDLGFKFSEILKENLKKVERRKREGKIHGSGSTR